MKKKKKEMSYQSYEKTWRKLKNVLLHGRSQPERATYYMIPTV